VNEAGPRLIDPADVDVRDVEWLVRHFVRRDTLNLVQGHGGVNKGTWTCHVGARATRGELSDGQPLMVLYASAEDEKETELKPRLLAAEADLRYVRFVEDVMFPRDVANGRLQACIREVRADVLFVDPLVTYMERIDAHKDQEVKQALRPILDVAQQERCTIVGVHHFTKDTRRGALLSGNGSGAFGNTARVVLAMVSDNEDEALRILEVVKSNGGPLHVNRLYRMRLEPVAGLREPLPTLLDIGESKKSVDEILKAESTPGNKRAGAKDIILRELSAEPKTMQHLKEKCATEVGASGETTWRATNGLQDEGKVEKYQTDAGREGSKWLWRLTRVSETTSSPPARNAHRKGTSTGTQDDEVVEEVVNCSTTSSSASPCRSAFPEVCADCGREDSLAHDGRCSDCASPRNGSAA